MCSDVLLAATPSHSVPPVSIRAGLSSHFLGSWKLPLASLVRPQFTSSSVIIVSPWLGARPANREGRTEVRKGNRGWGLPRRFSSSPPVPRPVLVLFQALSVRPEREMVLRNSLGQSGSRQVSGDYVSHSNNEAQTWSQSSGFLGGEAI